VEHERCVGERQSSDGTKPTAGFKHRKGTIMEKRRKQDENINDVFALLGCYTAFIGSCLLIFRINPSDP
jgi:hypothetical protein